MTAISPSRRIDHLVLPTKQIEAQVAFYQRLGFKVGARNIHPWGTENHIVQFKQSFLELITMGSSQSPPPHAHRQFSFGAHVQNWLATEGDGMSMLVLSSDDAAADAKHFSKARIGDFEPFHFRRKGKRPDGSETEVAFTLAFSEAQAMPKQSFFVCQQHYPENFWNPAMQIHENGVNGISRVIFAHDQPSECLAFFQSFAGVQAVDTSPAGFSLRTEKGMLSVWTPEKTSDLLGNDPLFCHAPEGRFAAVIFEVADIKITGEILRNNNIPHRKENGRIIVPSGAAFGIVLAFEQGEKP